MTDVYTVVCMQMNRVGIDHRKEIRKANLDRCLEIFGYGSSRLSFQDYAPLKLVVFPEVFMQGWNDNMAPYSDIYKKVAKDMAIRIPGEETDLLAEQAKKYKTYVAGSAHEVIPEISEDFAFNAGFIISPEGEVVYKRHKYCPYLPTGRGRDDISPHDVWDRYLEVMDGTYGRKKGDIVSCLFPVVETDIGKLGYLICNEAYYPEHSRALGLQGCEVMIRSSGMNEPEGSPPQQFWEITNRSHAAYNMMYVVACAPGLLYVKGSPVTYPGHSQIIDFHGAVLQDVPYPGETITSTQISIELLRRRRMDARHNWLTQLRTEAYAEMYKKPIYPINLFKDRLPTDPAVRYLAQPIKKFVEDGIFIPPAK